MEDVRRRIPSVDALLQSDEFASLLANYPRSQVTLALRRTLERLRDGLAAPNSPAAPTVPEIARDTLNELQEMDRPSLRQVINATGVPLHTNLGRAPLAAAAQEALAEIAWGYSNLEYDVGRGSRGSRHDHCVALLAELTGAGGALVVNNNAAAMVLALNQLADNREVIVSRGELVEFGGSFRVPDIVAKSGARIVEVGTTNRTHPDDYESAIGPATGALLKVHRSNFSQTGFVSEVEIAGLATIAQRHAIPLVHDLGSGLLPDAQTVFGLPWEPNVGDSLAAGTDLVTFSGDKLLGGPQAGIILGRAEMIDGLRRNPLLRAVRVGKLTLAALEATLRLWRDVATARATIPAVAMIATDHDALRERAERIARAVRAQVPAATLEVTQDVTEVGGGSYPGFELVTWVLRVQAPGRSERQLEEACRASDPPVVGRVQAGALCLDPRTVLEDEEALFIRVVSEALIRR